MKKVTASPQAYQAIDDAHEKMENQHVFKACIFSCISFSNTTHPKWCTLRNSESQQKKERAADIITGARTGP